jgi:DNA polymerase III subunit delta
VAELKPAYLISGDDDAKIDAWRARVRKRAEDENGTGGLESFDGRTTTPDEVAAALAALTFGTGTRYVMVDGVEAWKAGQLDALERELASPVPGTVLVLIARGKAPTRLAKAVEAAGGERREYGAPKPWELPRWAAERAQEEGITLDKAAAKRLVERAGPSQQRIAREVEKLAIAIHPDTAPDVETVARLTSGADGGQGYDVADAVVAGDRETALRLAEQLAAAGEGPSKLVWPVIRRLREVHRAAELLAAGLSDKDVASALATAPWIAKRTIAQAKKADRTALARALCVFADLEVQVRGGEATDEHTGFTRALARAAS